MYTQMSIFVQTLQSDQLFDRHTQNRTERNGFSGATAITKFIICVALEDNQNSISLTTHTSRDVESRRVEKENRILFDSPVIQESLS